MCKFLRIKNTILNVDLIRRIKYSPKEQRISFYTRELNDSGFFIFNAENEDKWNRLLYALSSTDTISEWRIE